ncbi:NADH dehydrogenase subunit L [Shewanella psychrophila]|uniref:NADH dehydrogenase subunit L n=1 Tax=Shewanella psychrophila TaxID=225848 RepID=A0A1S6HT32_9GAMM|nr:NADH-quinone oxidoreductase subunit L [Shewanella psychrophila]AQS38683.1 NADH dehydrogenase subunit L [Shewanella psychrophila]
MNTLFMNSLLMTIPLLPLCSAVMLILFQPNVLWARILGVSSVSLAALLAITLNIQVWEHELFIIQASFGEWLNINTSELASLAQASQDVSSINLNFGLYLDPLSLVMITIICCIGTLIHIYSASYMIPDTDQCRFFAYLNLFVSSMLILVLADNLVLLYLGWEGVGLCSYLLIGFWYQKTDNNSAANKAFIITRIGDTAMLIGIILLFYQFDTLNIQQIQQQSQALLQLNTAGESQLIALSCLLLFAGAAGKSAQMPLHSWLPDAMAGPTPVSALIHAATMVTAGVYLIARNDTLYQLAPQVLLFIAIIGLLTVLLGATSALFQTDLKRILAYSTISQLGYMFLALGVGAASTAIFHLMTHAFFKALLFLSAGALIYCMNHEQDIMKMGGLGKKLPLLTLSFAIGCAALASLPMTSGFFSKELILEQLAAAERPLLWWGALLGAFFTALYSAKLFFIIFLGKLGHSPSHKTPKVMGAVLIVLMMLSLLGGVQPQGVIHLFGELTDSSSSMLTPIEHWLPILVPLIGVLLAWFLFGQTREDERANNLILSRFMRAGWGFDTLFNIVFVAPFKKLTFLNRHDIIDTSFRVLEKVSYRLHLMFNRLQTGQLRSYSASLILFSILAIAWGVIR